MATPFYLLMHQDMRRTPRVRAVFDFVIEHLPVIKSLLACEPEPRQTRKPRSGRRFGRRPRRSTPRPAAARRSR
jgi:hypothetical protein